MKEFCKSCIVKPCCREPCDKTKIYVSHVHDYFISFNVTFSLVFFGIILGYIIKYNLPALYVGLWIGSSFLNIFTNTEYRLEIIEGAFLLISPLILIYNILTFILKPLVIKIFLRNIKFHKKENLFKFIKYI